MALSVFHGPVGDSANRSQVHPPVCSNCHHSAPALPRLTPGFCILNSASLFFQKLLAPVASPAQALTPAAQRRTTSSPAPPNPPPPATCSRCSGPCAQPPTPHSFPPLHVVPSSPGMPPLLSQILTSGHDLAQATLAVTPRPPNDLIRTHSARLKLRIYSSADCMYLSFVP